MARGEATAEVGLVCGDRGAFRQSAWWAWPAPAAELERLLLHAQVEPLGVEMAALYIEDHVLDCNRSIPQRRGL